MIKIIKKYKFQIIVIIVILISVTYMLIRKQTSPTLIINGENLSYNENKVYLDGAVVNPGVYKCKAGSLLKEIINAAGGLQKEADISQIDFNLIVKSGEKIIIPYIKNEIIVENSSNENYNFININTATKEELMNLDGIGEKTANKIIEYRESNEFECIEDIMNVEGIGKSKFSNIKDKIIVE